MTTPAPFTVTVDCQALFRSLLRRRPQLAEVITSPEYGHLEGLPFWEDVSHHLASLAPDSASEEPSNARSDDLCYSEP